MASTCSCLAQMGAPRVAPALPLRIVVNGGSAARHQHRRQSIALLTCGGAMGAHPILHQSCQALHRWHRGMLQKVRAKAEDEPAEPAEAAEALEEDSASQVVADAEDAVETAGSLLDLVEAADIADDVKEQLRGPASLLLEEVSTVRSEAETAQESLRAAQDRYLRLTADFDNYRKRTSAEKDVLKDRVKADTVKELLAVIDSFEMAKGQLKPEGEGEQKIDGAYQGVYKQMVEVFRSLGVEAVAGVGAPFDPEVHDAIMREEREDLPDGTVLKEFRRGFRLGAQLLRPAMVQVSVNDKPVGAQPAGSNGAAAAKEDEAAEGEAEEAEAAEAAAQGS